MDPLERVHRLVQGLRHLADPDHELGRAARVRLRASSGLSDAGIELAFQHALGRELAPDATALQRLMRRTVPAPRIWVSLSAGVFTAAHRAIAVALASSERVLVRASRRDPDFPDLLRAAAPGLFDLTRELRPEAGEHVHAYGTAETLSELRHTLPRDVVLHGHGPGFGVVVIGESSLDAGDRFERLAARLARDAAVFDQRGCLSPRAVLVEGEFARAQAFARALSAAMSALETEIPIGRVSADERAEIRRYRDLAPYRGELFEAGSGFIGVGSAPPLRIAPVARNLEVLSTPDAALVLAPHAAQLTTFGFEGDATLAERLSTALPRARRARIGDMQSPELDGPVDLREIAVREGL